MLVAVRAEAGEQTNAALSAAGEVVASEVDLAVNAVVVIWSE